MCHPVGRGQIYKPIEHDRNEPFAFRMMLSKKASQSVTLVTVRSARTNLPAHEYYASISSPCHRKCLASYIHAANTRFRPYIPETDSSITRAACQFRFFDRVKGNLFYTRRMSTQLRRVLYMCALRVPDA